MSEHVEHMSISLLDATLVKEGSCSACKHEVVDEDLFCVSISLPGQPPMYLHDELCFDEYLEGLNRFNSLRDRMHQPTSKLIN